MTTKIKNTRRILLAAAVAALAWAGLPLGAQPTANSPDEKEISGIIRQPDGHPRPE